MSAFDTYYGGAVTSDLLREFGQSDVVTYHPADGGSSSTFDAIVEDEQIIERESEEGRHKVRQRTFIFRTDSTAAEGGIASVELAGEIEYDSERWLPDPDEDKAIDASESMITVKCVRVGSIERSRAGYRTE